MTDKITIDKAVVEQALDALEKGELLCEITAAGILRSALSDSVEQPSIKAIAQKAGINMPATYIPTMEEAIAAGDGVLMEEQALLLRECRHALDDLLCDKPMLAAKLCGTTTLGNLRAMLYDYRPQGVMGASPRTEQRPLTDEEIEEINVSLAGRRDLARMFARAIEARILGSKT